MGGGSVGVRFCVNTPQKKIKGEEVLVAGGSLSPTARPRGRPRAGWAGSGNGFKWNNRSRGRPFLRETGNAEEQGVLFGADSPVAK